ncbi:MAG: hypothetical protein WD716_00250 [Fimbriimonadaceae bacterium]
MSERRRDPVASTLGLLTFLGGVGLIIAAFALAREMFATPPDVAMGVSEGQTLDLNVVLASGMAVLMKVVLLVVMAGFGSMVASRGIRLYVGGVATAEPKEDTKPQ